MAEQKMIDTRLSLTWLLTTGGGLMVALCTLIWNISIQSNKIDLVLQQQQKADKRQDNGDARIDHLSTSIYEIQRIDDKQDLRIDALERVARMQIMTGVKR